MSEHNNNSSSKIETIFIVFAIILGAIIVSASSNTSIGISSSFNETVNVDGNNIPTMDYYQRISLGLVDNTTSIHKFGSGALSTTPTIITQSGDYQTPTTPQLLEFVSDNAGDTFLGAGARQITIVGLGDDWKEQTVTINTSGTTPVQIPGTWLRVYRWWVSSSGTYAATGTASYLGNLDIQGTGGGILWTTILNTPITTGQSQIGVYTIPKCKEGYLIGKSIFIDTTRPADIYFFFRESADDITAPFNGTRRIIEREVGLAGGFNTVFQIPKGPFIGPADMGFFGSVTQGAGVASVEFELFLIDIPGCN